MHSPPPYRRVPRCGCCIILPPFPSSCCFLHLLLFVSLPSILSPYLALYALRPAVHTPSFPSSCALALRPVVQVYGASERPMPPHSAPSKPSGCRRIRLGVVEPTGNRRKLLTVSLVHGMVVVVVAERVVGAMWVQMSLVAGSRMEGWGYAGVGNGNGLWDGIGRVWQKKRATTNAVARACWRWVDG